MFSVHFFSIKMLYGQDAYRLDLAGAQRFLQRFENENGTDKIVVAFFHRATCKQVVHIVELTLKRIGVKLARLGEDAVFGIDGGGKMSTSRYVRARDRIIAVICYNANVTPLSHSTHLKDVTAKEGDHHLHKVRCVKIEAAIGTVDLDRCAKIAAVNDADLAAFDLFGKRNNTIQKLANGAAANADTVLLRIAHKGNRLFPTDGNGLINEHRDA